MNTVILAGGFGSRLKPITDNIVKPMLTLAGLPMLDYTVSHLVDSGIRDLVVTTAHKPSQIIEWMSGYRQVKCHFSIETYPLGTLGGVKAAERFLGDTFIVMSGDALEDIDLKAMLHKHRASNALVTICAKHEQNTSLYGVIEADAWGTVTNFKEKPKKGESDSDLISCGVYIVEKKVIESLPADTKMDFAKDLFPSLLNSGRISVYIHDGYWSDIGDFESYYKSNFYCLNNDFFPKCYNTYRSDYSSYKIGGDTKSLISTKSNLVGHISGSIIGKNSIIASGAYVENCLVLDDTVVSGRHMDEIIGNGFIMNMNKIDKILQNPQEIYQNSKIFS